MNTQFQIIPFKFTPDMYKIQKKKKKKAQILQII